MLRRSYREGAKVKHENLGNVSHLPPRALEALHRSLAGETLMSAEEQVDVCRSLPYGHVAAVLGCCAISISSGCSVVSAAVRGDDLPAADFALLEAVDDQAGAPDDARAGAVTR